jgi:hypothetical protein
MEFRLKLFFEKGQTTLGTMPTLDSPDPLRRDFPRLEACSWKGIS